MPTLTLPLLGDAPASDPGLGLLRELREIHRWRTRIPLEDVEPGFAERCEIERAHAARVEHLARTIPHLPPLPTLALKLARTGLPDPLLVDAFAQFLARCEVPERTALEIVSTSALYHLRWTALALESAPLHAAEVARAYRRRLRPADVLPTLPALTSGRPALGRALSQVWADDPEHTLDTLCWMAIEIASSSPRLSDPARDELAHSLLERARLHPDCTPLERIRIATIRRAHLLPCTDPCADLLVSRAVGVVSRHLDDEDTRALTDALALLEASGHPPAALRELLAGFPRLTLRDAAATACDILAI